MISKRLTAVFGYKVAGEPPEQLYYGFDADKATKIMEKAYQKGDYLEIRICRDIDMNWIARRKGDPVPA